MGKEAKSLRVTVFSIMIALSLMACVDAKLDGRQGENRMPTKTIEEVLEENTPELMSIPGVVGTAQGLCDDKPCIKVYVIKKRPKLERKIPGRLEGYPVSVEETGKIRALPKNPDQ